MLSNKRIFFASFPRSGSIWYLEMLGACLGYTKREMVYERTIKTHDIIHTEIKWFGHADKIFYIYRHPKDAILSYARYKHHDSQVLKWKKAGKIGKIDGRIIRSRFNEGVLREIAFKPFYNNPLIPIPWWISLMEYYMAEVLSVKVPVCYLKYEDVVLNPEKEVKKGLVFIGHPNAVLNINHLLSSTSAEERVKTHIGKYKTCEYWTKEFDAEVNEVLGDYIIKYGYER